jgi:predicted NBD/HSP70 family sugar kinase
VALAHAHAPDRVIVGGGVASAGSFVLDGLERAVNERLSFGLQVEVCGAQLGTGAALVGLGVLLGERQ